MYFGCRGIGLRSQIHSVCVIKTPDIEYLHEVEFHSYYGNKSQTENIYDLLRQIL